MIVSLLVTVVLHKVNANTKCSKKKKKKKGFAVLVLFCSKGSRVGSYQTISDL